MKRDKYVDTVKERLLERNPGAKLPPDDDIRTVYEGLRQYVGPNRNGHPNFVRRILGYVKIVKPEETLTTLDLDTRMIAWGIRYAEDLEDIALAAKEIAIQRLMRPVSMDSRVARGFETFGEFVIYTLESPLTADGKEEPTDWEKLVRRIKRVWESPTYPEDV